jgi:uncharacterized membrane protein
MRSFINLVLITLIIITAGGCYYDKAELLYGGGTTTSCSSISAKFGTDITPIMKNKCATGGCHDAAGSAGGVVLETYPQISGKADRINQRCIVDKTMPPGGPLLPAELAILKCWIDSGAPNN